MRRKDRRIVDRDLIDEIIYNGEFLNLGMCEGNIPYVVPLNYGYDGKCLFVHCAKMGQKINLINQNDNVSFSIVTKSDIIAGEADCEWTCDFTSVIGNGFAKMIKDIDEKRYALDVIMKNYSDKKNFSYPVKMIDKVSIIKIKIIEVSGKASNINVSE